MENNYSDINLYFEDVYNKSFDELKRYAAINIKNINNLRDLLQDVYMDFYKLLKKINPNDIQDEKALLYTICKRKLIKENKKCKTKELLTYDGDTDEVEDIRFEDNILNELICNDIWDIIQTRDKSVQKIFFLYFKKNMSLCEIAEVLSQPLHKIKNTLYRNQKHILLILNERNKFNENR